MRCCGMRPRGARNLRRGGARGPRRHPRRGGARGAALASPRRSSVQGAAVPTARRRGGPAIRHWRDQALVQVCGAPAPAWARRLGVLAWARPCFGWVKHVGQRSGLAGDDDQGQANSICLLLIFVGNPFVTDFCWESFV
jgi:hypothetical protein